jgi:hypothetical protein
MQQYTGLKGISELFFVNTCDRLKTLLSVWSGFLVAMYFLTEQKAHGKKGAVIRE